MAIIGIIGMLIFGTMTSIFSKLMLDTRYCPKYNANIQTDVEPYTKDNCPEYVKTSFSKPWFQTFTMFFAMTFCLAIHGCQMLYNDRKAKKLAQQIADDVMEGDDQPPVQKQSQVKQIFLIAVPCLFDMIASSVMTYGLVYIDVSIMQMLRGAMTVFSAIFNILCLKRKIRLYQWIAVILVCIALILVGVSCIMSSTGSTGYSWEYQLLGCCLVLLSAAIQACQLVVEDHLLANLSQPPNVVVGFEGLFGMVFTAICLIVLYFIPGSDDGSAENSIDSFYAFGTNSWICLFSCMFMVGCLGLNLSGMIVTQQTSSVVRAVMESVRTILIWVVDLLIYYWFWPHSVYGESWSTYSWIQLAGFIMLIFASQMYNGYTKFPRIFKYKFDDEQQDEELIPILEKQEEQHEEEQETA